MKIDSGKILFESEDDLPPVAMSLANTAWNQTGSWKYLEPYYQDLTPPCVAGCQAGNDIVTFMRLIEEGRLEEAARGVLQNNPFPASLGRVCPHPCENVCNRKEMGGEIAIQSAERFLGDYAIRQGLLPSCAPSNSKRVIVVGAGPAGLAAAYFLRILGYDVTIIDSEDRPGGLLWSGIPPYRLPRKVLEHEIQRFHKMGIGFEFNTRLGEKTTLDELRSRSAAVVLGIGLGRSRTLGVPGEDHPQVIDGIHLLKQLHLGKYPVTGGRVAVIGGGNTALDCARSLLRHGHDVTIYYRRSLNEMPAFDEEIKEALEEGVKFEILTLPTRVLIEDGKCTGLELIRMTLLDKDDKGRAIPARIEGSEFTVNADLVVKALGETLANDFASPVLSEGGAVRTAECQTAIPEVFACGDCLGNGGTVAHAVRSGREAASAVDAFVQGIKFHVPDALEQRKASQEIAEFDQFNRNYFSVEYRAFSPVIRSPKERKADFSEIQGSLSEARVLQEAARCFKCGTCTQCDNCRIYCPDAAIVRQNGKYRVLDQYCKGCMVCVEECPRSAIHLRKVEVQL